MSSATTTQLSDQAVACLGCACLSSDNQAARMLKIYCQAETPTGVLAAVFMAMAEGTAHIIDLARSAIEHERQRCTFDGRYGTSSCHDELMRNAG